MLLLLKIDGGTTMELTNDEKLFFADANALAVKKSVFEFVPTKSGKYVPVHKFFLHEIGTKTDADLINKFILPNQGTIEWTTIFKTGYKQQQELKTKSDITGFYFFYHDFDLKDPAGNHYIGNELAEKKEELLNRINTLPLEADYVVESRNGFHIYYTISPADRKTLTSAWWHHVQRGIYDYIYSNISSTVDHACKKSNQLLRLPGSFHQKKENTDLFNVEIIKTTNFSKKASALLNNTYSPGMFSHRIIDFMHAFNISTKLNETKTISTTKIDKPTKKTTKTTVNITINTFCRGSSYRNNSVVYAISQKNPNDACFENIKTDAKNKFGDRTISITDATEYIKSIDLRTILNVNYEPRNAINSLFYSDINPSDYFYQSENHTVSYYCRCEDTWYNSIFDIIAKVFYPDKTLTTENWSDVYKFAYEMFGLNVMFKNNPTEVTAQFDKIRADNINTFKSIVAHSKKTKYLKAYTDLYELIMDLWAEHVNEYNIPYMQAHRDLGAEWLSSKLAERGIKKDRRWITRGLMILRFIGVLTKIVGNQNSKVSLPDTKQGVGDNVNRYTFPILKTNIDEIIKRAEIIRFTFDKPSIQVSEKKLTELALDYDLESAFTKL